MFGQKAHVAVIALTVLSLPASQLQACEFLRRCFGGTTAYYAPVAPTCCPQPACCPQPTCCPQQQVSYMPQTCYRTVYANVPVVAYRPMTSCDPCTGCPRTVMSPVTSYVTQARLVPYTSYRQVVTTNYAPACSSCAAPAVATAYYQPAAAIAPAVSYAPPVAAPSCCGGGAPSLSGYPPATGMVGTTVPSLAPAPAVAAPSYPSSVVVAPQNVAPAAAAPQYNAPPTNGPSTTGPALGAPPETSNPGQTFEQPGAPAAEPQSRMQPLRLSPSSANPLGAPQSLDPESQDRMTRLPIRQALAVKPVSLQSTVSELNTDGEWRTASK